MPSPEVRNCTTSDGVDIAVWILGEGPAFVMMPAWWSFGASTYDRVEGREWLERLAKNWRVIRYDNRGTGDSQRDAMDFSLDARVRDLDAVVNGLELEALVLFGYAASGPASIAYARRWPDRISNLILWCTSAKGSEQVLGGEAAVSMAESAWDAYLDSMFLRAFGWSSADLGRRSAEAMLPSITPEAGRKYIADFIGQDVTPLLSELCVPTLVLHRRQSGPPDVAVGRAMATRIRGAKWVVLEGESSIPYFGDKDSVLREIADFTGVDGLISTDGPVSVMRTVLWTDLVGHTEMMQRLGDERGRAVLREHERITRDVLKAHDGQEIKTMGDGFMASFGSVTKAVACAIALQRAFATHTESMAEPLHVRVGLNAGEPIAEEGDLFGSTVILASRICAQAGAGEILIPDTVRGLLTGKRFLYSDRGHAVLQGFEDPVRLYEVRWREGA